MQLSDSSPTEALVGSGSDNYRFPDQETESETKNNTYDMLMTGRNSSLKLLEWLPSCKLEPGTTAEGSLSQAKSPNITLNEEIIFHRDADYGGGIRRRSLRDQTSPTPSFKPTMQSDRSARPPESTNISNLKVFLSKFFRNENVFPIPPLSRHELSLLSGVLTRKYGKPINFSRQEDLEANIQQIMGDGSHKRPEENYKFVFKRCLDYMKENFRRQHPEIKKALLDRRFYEHYFLKISEQTGLCLEHFFDPKNTPSEDPNIPKTINGTYIKNISKSEAFTREFKAFMNGSLRAENLASLQIKIDALVTKWEKVIAELNNIGEATARLRKDVETNKKAKLPWTIREIDDAITSVSWLFDQNTEKKP